MKNIQKYRKWAKGCKKQKGGAERNKPKRVRPTSIHPCPLNKHARALYFKICSCSCLHEIQNLQHETCSIFSHDFNDIKNLT